MKPRARVLVAYLSGVLFALGLGLGGMTRPERILGFLDFFGDWDPTLAFVMAGALAVYAVAHRRTRRRRMPILGGAFIEPARAKIDRRLMLGATVFGAGWGLAGYCPGPALVSVASGARTPIVFAAAMLLGIIAHRVLAPGSGRALPKRLGDLASGGAALPRSPG